MCIPIHWNPATRLFTEVWAYVLHKGCCPSLFPIKCRIFSVGGSEKSEGSPNTRVWNKSTRVAKSKETKNLRKTALGSKVVNPFTRALAPLFIWRRRDFYIPKIPSNVRNIPSVNIYMNVFYKPALVHTSNPDFWGNVFDLASCWFPNLLYMKIFMRHNLRI
jgi:hypothetical protein